MEREIVYRKNARKEVSEFTESVIKLVMETAGVERVDLSSTRRTIPDQARIMYNNIKKYVDSDGVKSVAELKKKRAMGYHPPGRAVDQVYFDNIGKSEKK